MRILLLMFLMIAGGVQADTVIAVRTIPARQIILPDDVKVSAGDVAGHASALQQVVGMEVSTTVYADRPIALSQLTSPAIIERNQLVTLVFWRSGLEIETDGRALDRGGIGSRVRVMNQSSRNTVIGVIAEDGRIIVGAAP